MFLQVPQFILEAAQSAGQLHNIKIVAAQPRRLITTGGTSAALAPELLLSSASKGSTAAELLLNSTLFGTVNEQQCSPRVVPFESTMRACINHDVGR
jgi:hypothetical protein